MQSFRQPQRKFVPANQSSARQRTAAPSSVFDPALRCLEAGDVAGAVSRLIACRQHVRKSEIASNLLANLLLRLSRARGFRLQAHSRAVNGLAAVCCARPGKWGNPYRIAPAFACDYVKIPAITADTAVILFREHLEGMLKNWESTRDALEDLRGKNLACWCALPKPGEPDICHAAVLLDLANRPICEPIE